MKNDKQREAHSILTALIECGCDPSIDGDKVVYPSNVPMPLFRRALEVGIEAMTKAIKESYRGTTN